MRVKAVADTAKLRQELGARGRARLRHGLAEGTGRLRAWGPNPEELFAAGYAACFAQALVRAARDCGIALGGPPAVTAAVGVGRLENGRLSLAVELRASLPGVERPWAEALVAKAHAEICPDSRATRGSIAVRTAVE